MVIKDAYGKIKDILKSKKIPDSEFDAMCIAEDILGVTKTDILVHPEKEIHGSICEKAFNAAKKRASGYPLQYILGKWEFYGLSFKVGEGVLIPRPDTEILAETVIGYFKNKKNPRIIDLCSGSGCIALALKKNLPDSEIFAVEKSEEAMPYLTENIRSNNLCVKVIRGDIWDGRLLENFADRESDGDYIKFDCIVSNPPYVTTEEMRSLQTEVMFEPSCALDGGTDGLKFYRVISCLWSEVLADNGLMAFEIGESQGNTVCKIMEDNGFENIRIIKDYSGNTRVVIGNKKKKAY